MPSASRTYFFPPFSDANFLPFLFPFVSRAGFFRLLCLTGCAFHPLPMLRIT